MTASIEVLASDLRLADTVLLQADAAYACATVKNVTDTEVTLFRPYTQTADFSYAGGVICYIGIEEFKVPRNSANVYTVVARKGLK